MRQNSQNCCQNILALRNQLLQFYTQQSTLSYVGAVALSVQQHETAAVRLRAAGQAAWQAVRQQLAQKRAARI